jgi:eukaryotic-like serine/threonine-protein kinase
MTPEQWQHIQDLFEQALNLGPVEREAFLQGLSPELSQAVRSLVEADQLGSQPIAQAIAGVAAPSASESTWIGRRLGTYRIAREIGRGGMGVVFEAVRDDDQFRKRVAIKIAVRASLSPVLREAFRRERQILAELDHPNISKLIDGGETEEGLPYFVMEYVEGVPINAYCSEKKLSIRDRLHLFLEVCDAVDYAHQHLVVHRDIKPGNVLVTADGVPKLLDFGVAKLLDQQAAEAGGSTQTAFVPVTPDYCSPEQLRSLRITTRTDVYLLGLVLYELLTGFKASAADTSSPTALEHSICEAEPTRASTVAAHADPSLAKALAGDLDTIIEKAIRKEPEARFASAGELASEIRLHLEGKPIRSRAASFGYRTSRFVRRNRVAVAGSAVLALALIAGVAGTLFQARRAARRFEQVRGIAHTLIFDVHDSIKNVAGTVKAQELVVTTGLQYLDRLSEEVSGDSRLLLEIAEGYIRIGNIQGSDLVPSLSDRVAAKKSATKANRILKDLIRLEPGSEPVAVALADCQTTLAELQARSGESKEAMQGLKETEALIEPIARKPASGLDVRRRLGLVRLSMARDFGFEQEGPARAEALLEAVRLMEAHPDAATHPEVRGEIAVGSSVAGGVYTRLGNIERAAPLLEKSVALHRLIVQDNPQNHVSHRGLMLAHAKVAALWAQPGPSQDRAKAAPHFDGMLREAEWLYQSDPNRKASRVDLAMASIRSSEAFPSKDPGALQRLERGIRMLEEVAQLDPKDMAIRRNTVDARIRVGMHHRERAEWGPGIAALHRAASEIDEILKREPGRADAQNLWMRAHMELGRLYAVRGDKGNLDSVVQRLDGAVLASDLRPRVDKWKADVQRLQQPGAR